MPDDMLPAIPGQDDVLEGEVVGDGRDRPPAVRVTATVTRIIRHPVARHGRRHMAYIPLGAVVVVKRLWESRTTSRYEKWMRAAEAAGNHEAALQWDERRSLFMRDRHQRRMDWASGIAHTILLIPKLLAGLVAVLGLIGFFLAVAEKRFGALGDPFRAVAGVVLWTWIFVSAAWALLLLLAVAVTLAAFWQVGRLAAESDGPARLRTSTDDDADMSIDEHTVAEALKALRIPQVRDYLNKGIPLQFLVPCRQEGRGTYCEVRLPVGVPAERITRRRSDLASGLYRLAKEVWPGTGAEAAILTLWVADKGALAEGAGPYPLLDDGLCDVFRGVPFGRTLRGDPLAAPLMERNTICGGMPGQGKSSAARVILCGAALDRTAEIRIAIPDTNFDFEALKPRCSVYIMGAETERIAEIRDQLVSLHAEVQERGELLVQHGVPAVTRELASAGVGLHPLFFLLEEAHVAITHAEYGKEISGKLVDIVRLGRKRGIHMIVSTQAPTKDSMPRDVTRNCSNGIAYAVGDHVANDALLGQGAYRGGHRATELIPGTDRGIAVVKGFTGERSDMVQCYFVPVDQVPPIIERALREIARRGGDIPGTGRAMSIEQRDLLTDVDEVLRTAPGNVKVRLADLPARLRQLAPAWGPYRSLTGSRLRQMLEDEGVRVVTKANVSGLYPDDLRRAISERESEG